MSPFAKRTVINFSLQESSFLKLYFEKEKSIGCVWLYCMPRKMATVVSDLCITNSHLTVTVIAVVEIVTPIL